MKQAQASVLLRHLRDLVAEPGTERASDRELLRRFARQRDEAAFTTLVQRHGPMILRLGRRMLHNWHDAEDVCQASFLLLASKASARFWDTSVAGWLHRVAYHLALKAHAATLRRRATHPQPADESSQDPLDLLSGRELRAVLDEELSRLPAKYRTPLVLCYLEGATRDEAAAQLGWPLGTLKSRVERGRELLALRLTERGLALSVVLAAVALVEDPARAALPAALCERLARGALTFAATKTVPVGAVSLRALALAQTALKSMMLTKLKVAAALLFAVSALAGMMGVVAYRTSSAEQPADKPQEGPKHSAQLVSPTRTDAEPVRRDSLGDPLPNGALARIGTTRLRAISPVNVVAFSPDGRWLAFGADRESIRICEAANGKGVAELRLEENDSLALTTELAFSPDGRILAAGSYSSPAITLFDVGTQKIRRTIPNSAEGQNRWAREWQGSGFAFTPDGRALVVGGKDGALHLWNPETGTELAALVESKECVLSLTLTADGRTALTAHSGGELHLWDVTKRKHLRKLTPTAKYPHLAVLAPDGKTVALAGNLTDVELWAPDGMQLRVVHAAATITGLGFSPDGASLGIADAGGIVTTWDVRSGAQRDSLTCAGISIPFWGNGDPVNEARMGTKIAAWFRPDAKTMAWADVSLVCLWDLTTRQETPRLSFYHKGIDWAGFSADGRLVRAGGVGGELGVWDAVTGRLHRSAPRIALSRGIRYTPARDRGKVVAITALELARESTVKPSGGRILLWDPGEDTGAVPLREPSEPAQYAALTPDNRSIVAVDAGGQIRVYDAASGKAARSFKGRRNEHQPTFSPDGTILALIGGETFPLFVRLYDFAGGKPLRDLKGISSATCLAFAPDGSSIAVAHANDPRPRSLKAPPSNMIHLWETATGRELRRIPTGEDNIQALSFSPDGRLVASFGYELFVRLWEVASGQVRWHYIGHRKSGQSVDFSPDGERLVSASQDGTALVWQVFSPGPAERSAVEIDALWADLAREGMTAHQAMAALLACRGTVPFLSGHLKAAVQPSDDQVKQWLADLGSSAFKTREAAQKELARASETIEPALRRGHEAASDPEVRRRLTELVDNISRPESRPEQLRDLRAVEVLERLASAEARRLLESLTQGVPAARQTREARAAVARLERRGVQEKRS